MVRIRHGWLVAALALGFATSACKKEEKKPPAGPGAIPGMAEKPGAPGATPGAPGGVSATDLGLLPVDSEVVMGINFAQIQKSALWKKFVEPQLLKPDVQEKLTNFKNTCGIDPMASLSSMSMGLKGVGGDKPDGVIVLHGVDKAKMMPCFEKMKPEAAKEGSTITVDGDVVTIASKDGDTVAFTYVDNTTAVGVVGANANAAGVKAAAAGTSALKTSPAFVDLYKKINTADSLWFLANTSAKAFDSLGALGSKPKQIYGSINVTDGFAAEIRARMESPDQATQLSNMMSTQIQPFKAMVDKVEVAADGADVKISAALSTQKLEALVKNFGGMMGGLGGGM